MFVDDGSAHYDVEDDDIAENEERTVSGTGEDKKKTTEDGRMEEESEPTTESGSEEDKKKTTEKGRMAENTERTIDNGSKNADAFEILGLSRDTVIFVAGIGGTLILALFVGVCILIGVVCARRYVHFQTLAKIIIVKQNFNCVRDRQTDQRADQCNKLTYRLKDMLTN